MNSLAQFLQPSTVAQELASKRDIPVEWIKSNCVRSGDKWEIRGNGTGIQYYPDKPRLDDKGKPIKYESPKGSTPDIFIVNTPDGEQNPYVIALDNDGRTWITEGHFKAIKACSVGIATVSVSGIWNALAKGSGEKRVLVETLQGMIEIGIKKFGIAFDADAATNPLVHSATLELAKTLSAAGCDVIIATGQWTVDEGKGMDDFISKNGAEAMKERLERALTLEAYEAQDTKPKKENNGKGRKGRVETLRAYFGNNLRYNEMTGYIERDEKYLDAEHLHVQLADENVLDAPAQECIDISVYLSKQNSYHPFVDYLDSVRGKHNLPVPDEDMKGDVKDEFIAVAVESLNHYWDDIFGTIKPLEKTYLTKTMVATIARVLKPGCMMQTMLLLVGAQGTRKSTFLRDWGGTNIYSNAYRGTVDKDDILKLMGAVIHEIAEFDKIFSKTDTATLKDIITTEVDQIRVPYGRTTQRIPRRCILTGSSNRFDVLRDPTGSRRFWVVNVSQKIDTTRLVEVRDALWATALALYDAGYGYTLNEFEEAQREFHNEMFKDIDPIRDHVEDYCFPDGRDSKGLPDVTIKELFEAYEDSNIGKNPNRQEERAITDALRSLGYINGGDKKKKLVNGKRVRCWVLSGVTTEVGVPVTEVPVQWRYSAGHHTQQGDTSNCTGVPPLSKLLKNEVVEDDFSVSPPQKVEENVLEILAVQPVHLDENPCPASDYVVYRSCTSNARFQVTTEVTGTTSRQPKVGDEIVITSKNAKAPCGERCIVEHRLSNYGVMVSYQQKTIAGRTQAKKISLGRDDYQFVDKTL